MKKYMIGAACLMLSFSLSAQTVQEPASVKPIRAAYQQAQKIKQRKDVAQVTLNALRPWEKRAPSQACYTMYFQKSDPDQQQLVFVSNQANGHEFASSEEYLFEPHSGRLLFYFSKGGEAGFTWEQRLYYQNGTMIFYRTKTSEDDGANYKHQTGTSPASDDIRDADARARQTAQKLLRVARDFIQ